MIPGLVAAKAITVFGRNWKLIAGGAVLLGLVVALLLTRATLSSTKQDLETQRRATAAEQAEHAITRSSVGTLQAVIKRQNDAITERAAALEAAKAKAALELAAADQKWQATADQVSRLRALAKEVGRPGCEAPKKLLLELEGL